MCRQLRRVGDRRESRAGQGLQDEPRVVAQRPQLRIKLLPQMVGRVIVGPTQVEREFREGIRTEWFSHAPSGRRIAHRLSGGRSVAFRRRAIACATIARASASMRCRCASPRKLSA